MQRRHEPQNIPTEILRSFVTVLDTGSFTKAATLLGLTQSAISAQMKRLQRLLGDELFVRGVANITLTERGKFAGDFARRMLALNDQLISGATEGIRLGLPSLLGGNLLRGIFRQCKDAGADVRFHCDSAHNLRKRFEAGHLDVFLELSPDPLSHVKLSWVEPVAWVSAPEFLFDSFGQLPLLSWPGSPGEDLALRALNRSALRYDIVVVAPDLASHLEALHANLGYAVLAERAVPETLKLCREHFLPKLGPMHVGIRSNRDLDGKNMDAVVQCLKNAAAPESYALTG